MLPKLRRYDVGDIGDIAGVVVGALLLVVDISLVAYACAL